jgi:hypothetical protein
MFKFEISQPSNFFQAGLFDSSSVKSGTLSDHAARQDISVQSMPVRDGQAS